MTNGNTGKLIAFCGLDGAGKTTQLDRLGRHLEQYGTVFRTTLPTDWFRQDPAVRAYLNQEIENTDIFLSELALFSSADRLRYLRSELQPRLAAGEIILCDRHILSAYTSLLAAGFKDLPWLMSLNRLMPVPDLTIYLDIDPAISSQRVLARDGAAHKRQEVDLEFLARTRAVFIDQPWGPDYLPRYAIIDGSGAADVVEAKIREAADELFDGVAAG